MFQELRQYFKSREARSRIENTEPFDLDPKIRIAYDEKDLAVIHHPDVKAVLWKREITPEILDDLALYEKNEKGDGQQCMTTPDSIIHDVADVNESFNQATNSSAQAQIKYFHSNADNKQQDRASFAHVDNNITLRALACYTLDINAATQYYPGDFSRDDIKRINEELDSVSTSEERNIIKERYGVQTLEMGEVLIIKGLNFEKNLGSEGQLLHSGPEQYDGGVFRYLTI